MGLFLTERKEKILKLKYKAQILKEMKRKYEFVYFLEQADVFLELKIC